MVFYKKYFKVILINGINLSDLIHYNLILLVEPHHCGKILESVVLITKMNTWIISALRTIFIILSCLANILAFRSRERGREKERNKGGTSIASLCPSNMKR